MYMKENRIDSKFRNDIQGWLLGQQISLCELNCVTEHMNMSLEITPLNHMHIPVTYLTAGKFQWLFIVMITEKG